MQEQKSGVSNLKNLLFTILGIQALVISAIILLFIQIYQIRQNFGIFVGAPQDGLTLTGLESETQAPAFQLMDTNEHLVSLASFQGNEVLLVFTWTECIYCEQMYPYLQQFDEEDDEIQVIMISRGSQERTIQIREEQGFEFPVLFSDETILTDYAVPGTPFFYLIDKEGQISRSGVNNSLEQILAMVSEN